jgi:hypothetical protein
MTAAAERIWIETDPFNADEPLLPIVAAGYPLKPPKDWFTPPTMLRATPLQVLPNGRVYGHIAPWTARHTGLPGNVRPPRSRHNYAFFRTGQVETSEGDMVPVGQITLAGGHAPITADADRAVAHYDDTRSAFADVNVGEDKHGIWVAGALRPDVTDTQLRAIRAAVPSGDWRPINGGHELIAICQVNSPGFPVPRAEALVAGGQLQAIVAAGAQDMFAIRMLDAFLPYLDDTALTAAIDARVDAALRREHLRDRMRR